MPRCFGVAVFVCLCALASPASATCMEVSSLVLLFDDCSMPSDGLTWPAELPVSFTGDVGSCCNAGPCSGGCTMTYQEPYNVDQAVIKNEKGEVVRKAPSKVVGCMELPIYTFDGPLPPGTYTIQNPMENRRFVVAEGPGVERVPIKEKTRRSSHDCGREFEAPEAPVVTPPEGGCAGCVALDRPLGGAAGLWWVLALGFLAGWRRAQ